jgi:hypothetical protein
LKGRTMRTAIRILQIFIFIFLTAGVQSSSPLSPLDSVRKLSLSDKVRADEERLIAIVQETLEQGQATPLFGGPRGDEATALLMLGIAFHESGLKHSVESCKEKGDHGFAYGLPQMHEELFSGPHRATKEDYTTEEVCNDRTVQWLAQAQVLARAKAYCKSVNEPTYEDKGPIVWTANYHSGISCTPDSVSYMHYANFMSLAKRSGIRIEKRGSKWIAR